ncbi:MAG: RNA polymerase factor sigma-54 [Eubacteriales bacterium]
MKLGIDLNVKQKQNLVINEQLIQSINILQYNINELTDYINMELVKNPLLEKDEIKTKKNDEIDWEKYVNNFSQPKLQDLSDNVDDDNNSYLFAYVKESLKDVLTNQLHLLDLSIEERYIGEIIIDFIDERGYLSQSPEKIGINLNIDEVKILEILEKIRCFEPSGVGGENLKECLAIQLKNMGIDNANLYELIQNYLEDLAYHRDQRIITEMKLNKKLLEEYRMIIQSLDPKPGLKYCVEKPDYVIPDIFIDLINDKIIVEINETYIPSLKINEYYVELLKRDPEEKTKEFIKSKLNAASFVVNSILQRRETIRNISRIIFDRQKEFIKNGDTALNPLTLKEVAQMIDVHESTVSRAIKNKYVATPRGIYALKHFFSVGLYNTYGDDVSVIKVKEKIKELIKNENKKIPLSDQNITNMLKENGYEISRRTVAKYRDQLFIPSTRERRVI